MVQGWQRQSFWPIKIEFILISESLFFSDPSDVVHSLKKMPIVHIMDDSCNYVRHSLHRYPDLSQQAFGTLIVRQFCRWRYQHKLQTGKPWGIATHWCIQTVIAWLDTVLAQGSKWTKRKVPTKVQLVHSTMLIWPKRERWSKQWHRSLFRIAGSSEQFRWGLGIKYLFSILLLHTSQAGFCFLRQKFSPWSILWPLIFWPN